jgi:chaperone required for assembly of F1-ATPase
MRELFENAPPQDPIEAARRDAKPALRRRFYGKASSAAAAEGGFVVQLDGRPARTPAGRVLAAPVAPLAEAIAAEWEAQREVIDPAAMPLTRLTNSIIDGVSDRADAVAAEVRKYLASDLVCYRAAAPQKLVERQTLHWDPIIGWAADTLGAHFSVTDGIIHIAQPDAALAAASAAIPQDTWRLGAVHAATTLSGSALIALALAAGRLSAEEAWTAAHLDEDWNIEQWGEDELAMQRRAVRFAEFAAAARVLKRA